MSAGDAGDEPDDELLSLENLAAIGAAREGRAVPALELLAEQVHGHADRASARLLRETSHLTNEGGEANLKRALELSLLSGSLRALGPRASRAVVIASLFQLVCLVVLVMVEFVVLVVLVSERDRLFPVNFERGTLFLYALAAQLLAAPLLRRWIEKKLVWESFDELLDDLTAAMRGLDAALAHPGDAAVEGGGEAGA